MGKTSQVYQLRKEKISHSRYGVLAVHKHDCLLARVCSGDAAPTTAPYTEKPQDSCESWGSVLKGGGHLLSRIALQYHRRKRA